MEYFIGIDGGGTKTTFILCDRSGAVLADCRAGSANYKQIGKEGLLELLQENLQKLTADAGLDSEDTCYTCLGLPMYRESREFDEWIEAQLLARFSQWHILTVNDSEVGWAGSLGLASGINIISGTGSISFGRNDAGKTVSAGGWSDYFSDEGSCKWLGVKCMELFSKEADGRLPKGALYRVIRQEFKLDQDKDMIEIFERDYMPYRDKIASLQKYLLTAAEQRDAAAVQAYEQAADELMLILNATAEQLGLWERKDKAANQPDLQKAKGAQTDQPDLQKKKDTAAGGTDLPQEIRVTCSGGLFKAGEMIRRPLVKRMQLRQMILAETLFSPQQGAVLLAAEHWMGREAAEQIKTEWGKKKCF